MFVKLIAATLGAGLIVAAPVAGAAPAPSSGWYLCHKPHTTVAIWNGKVHRQVWCKNPAPSGRSGFRPLHAR